MSRLKSAKDRNTTRLGLLSTRSRSRWTSAAAIALVPALLAVLAILNPGIKVSQVDLNDGSVWLTNTNQLKLGRFNAQIDELNAGLVATNKNFDVVQDGSDVLLLEADQLSVVDPAGVALRAQVPLPTGAQVALGNGTVAITSPDGSVWIHDLSLPEGLNTDSENATWSFGEGAATAVTTEGVVLTLDPTTGKVHRAQPDAGAFTFDEVDELTDAVGIAPEQSAAVGQQLIVLADGRLHAQGWSLDLPSSGGEFALQTSGAENDTVLVGSQRQLLRVPIKGRSKGDAGGINTVETGGTGKPARPAHLNGCDYGAWSSQQGNLFQDCPSGKPEMSDLEGLSAGDEVVFRINRSVIVLNDVLNGSIWLPEEAPQKQEPNWQDIESQEELEEADDLSEDVESTKNLLADCTEQSPPPQAKNDSFGVRAARSIILDVLGNDVSASCGIITISEFDDLPESFGTVESVYGGRALQVRVSPNASGEATFSYTIGDGRGVDAPSTATVTLTVRPDSVNEPPRQTRKTSAEVEIGGTVRVDVLADFMDPDGDDLQLASAVTTGEGTIRVRPDGILTFIADLEDLGRKTVDVEVFDGTDTGTGTVFIDVRAAGSLPPVIDPVLATGIVDKPIEVDVLARVQSMSREPARLAGVDEVDGADVSADLGEGTFEFTAEQAGTYYVPFTVTATPQQAAGLARIDVLDEPEETLPPLAVRDTALLPAGGEVTIDPLANDEDPNGGVLVLVSAEVGQGSALKVGVLEHHLLQISSTRTLERPETITYVVSNGTHTSRGEILVQPVPPSKDQRPPVVEDITVSVRTGGVITIGVLEHAYDPEGDELILERELQEQVSEGLLFVSGNRLRYQAPEEPTTARAVFEVSDPSGNTGSGTLTVHVHESDEETKSPPRPKNLVARVFEGESARISVPLLGIDDDGDGVSLLGEATAPTKGRIIAVGADYLEYEAFPGEVGTDTFTYAVEDWLGQRSVASVRIGIAPRPSEALPILARDDEVTVQPGERVEVRVLVNDDNPSGGDLILDPNLEIDDGVEARVGGRRIVVQTSNKEEQLRIGYRVSNDRGAQDSAILTVNVLKGAVIDPPLAEDVVVPPIDTLNKTSVEVDVLAVAENPSGPMSDLLVSVPPSHAAVANVTLSEKVTVTLGPTAQTIPYLLTNTNPNAKGVGTYAFITVPALGDFPPVLRPNAPPLRVATGSELTFDLDEFVQVAPGKNPSLTEGDRVSATKSDGTSLVVDSKTLRYVPAAGYAGPASITFEVTDGRSGSDPDAKTKTLSLPITVYATEAFPPSFTPSLIEVPQGEAPVSIDLSRVTRGPEGENEEREYGFALKSDPPAGFTARLNGSILEIGADATTPRGSLGSVGIGVDYGGTSALDGLVEFRVSASTRQVARVNNVKVDGVSGKSTNVSVLDGAFNPYPGSPLTVAGAAVETPGSGTVSVSGTNVTVTPSDGFIGEMVVRFRVRDVTNEPSREVEGRVRVSVRAAPDAPRAPRISEARDRAVALSWDAPANNASPITGYEVTRSPGGQTTSCSTTSCTIDGLTNNTEYTFAVRARNAVGWSSMGPSSATARPDQVPARPSAPSTEYGDARVTATWPVPESPGSAVSSYTVRISPAPPSGPASVTTSTPNHTFRNLANGVEYRVQVKAHNRAEGDSGWGPESSRVAPAGVPGRPEFNGPRSEQGANGRRVEVSWGRPSRNGADIEGYSLEISGDGSRRAFALGAEAKKFVFNADKGVKNGVSYTFSLTATNKAGTSSAGTVTAKTWGTPGSPESLSVSPSTEGASYGNGELVLAWERPSDTGGLGIDHYEVDPGDGTRKTASGRSYTVKGLAGGQSTTVKVRACNTEGVCGSWASGSGTPVTAPRSPGLSVTLPGQREKVRFSVDGRQNGGAALGQWQNRMSVDGGSEQSVEPGTVIDVRNGGSVKIRSRVRNSSGWSEWAKETRNVAGPDAPAAPNPSKGGSAEPGELKVKWTKPANNGRQITSHKWRLLGNGSPVPGFGWATINEPDVLQLTRDDAPPGTYTFQVRAINAVGEGAIGSLEGVTVAPAP